MLFVANLMCAAQASQTYWVCTDAQGNKTAQDHPCDPNDPSRNRREARPNVVPSGGSGVGAAAGLPDLPSSARQAAARAPSLSPIVIKAVAGLGVVALLGLAVFALKELFRRAATRSGADDGEGSGQGTLLAGRKPVFGLFGRRPTSWSLELIAMLGPARFEALCAGLWAAEGYRTQQAEGQAGSGIRIRFFNPDDPGRLAGIIQCHAGSTEPVGIGPLRELYGNIAEARAAQGVVVTSTDFTADARLYAGGKPIELVEGAALLRRLQALPADRRAALLKQISRRGYRR